MGDLEESEDIGSLAKGKQGELIVIGKLLERGHKVYLPMVDTGIDCLIDVGEGNYKEIQVKYRETEPIFQARDFKPRDNFYVICFLRGRHGDDFRILPSKTFKQLANPTKIQNRDYLQLRIGKEGSETYKVLASNFGNWSLLLSGATTEVRKTVESASKRVEGEHFKMQDYEREILAILSTEQSPLQTKEILVKLGNNLKSRFSKADLEPTRAGSDDPRWMKTARFAIYQFLKKKGMITAPTKNQWVITPKGHEFLKG